MRFVSWRWWFLLVVVCGWILAAGTALALPGAPARVEVDPAGRRLRIALEPVDVTFVATGGGEVVGLARGAAGELPPGAPALPVLRLTVCVDGDFAAEAVRVVAAREVSLGTHAIAPVERPGVEVGPARIPDPAYYGARELVPLEVAAIEGEGWLRGRRLVHLAVHPVRVNPETSEVVLARELELELVGREGAAAAGRAPRAVRWEAKVERSLGAVAVDLRRRASPLAAPVPLPERGLWSPTYRPTADGSPVEYVIVTSEALAPAFQALADWKTKKGVGAVVRTTEWIRATYPNGVDRAEQLRFFLSDAYENWGTLWVLLGGDSDVIPVRYGTHTLTNAIERIPTDLYYSCLDGNWNGDGDAEFGEGVPPGHPIGGDGADLEPDLYVGRATVSAAAAAAVFVSKTIDYEKAVGASAGWPASALLLGEQLSPSSDGAEFCEDVWARLPAGMRTVRMYENFGNYQGALPEILEDVIDSLNAGFGIVHHVGHGFRNTMSVGSGTLNNSDIDNLVNGNRQSVVYAINCSSAAIDFNSIGERFLKNPNGGGVAYIGSTRVAVAGGEYRSFQNEFYELVFQDSMTSVGEALALSKVPFLGDAVSETVTRWLEFAVMLLGDPELPIWRRGPEEIFANHSSTYLLGAGNYSVVVNVAGSPLDSARVALVKSVPPPGPVEEFAVGWTGANGIANLAFNPPSTGTFSITVTRPDYGVKESVATVTSTASPFLIANGTSVNDDALPPSSGNGDGQPDAGERVELGVRLKNAGGATATGVSATLSVVTGGAWAAVVQGVVSYGTLAAGGQSFGAGSFVVDLSAAAPDAFEPLFGLAITSGQGTWTDTFVLPVKGVELEHYGHVLTDPAPNGNGNGIPENLEAIVYRVTARNNGTGRADGVGLGLRVLNRQTMQPDPQVTVTDGTSSFGNLVPGAVVQALDPLGFTIGASAVVSDLLLELAWSDSHGGRGVGLSDLVPPGPVTDLAAQGAVTAITLTWTPPLATDVRGYDVYRSPTAQGGFVRINAHTGAGSATYEDSNLQPLTRYYYQVVARDSSYSASVPSAILSATTTPPLAAGWPIETSQETTAGVVADDLDRTGRTAFELVTGADAIYAWHHDGAELRDGDANPLTSGVFSTDGQNGEFGFHATPAIADLTGDGDLEIIGVAWRDARVYVWNVDGTREPGWPQVIGGDFNWASPAVEDLDLDGRLEIVVASGQGGKIFAWHSDGTEVADGDQNPNTNGVLFVTGFAFLYSSPAIGNIDADPYPEIVFGTQSSAGWVYALKRTGALATGWPVETHGQVTASPALANLDGLDGDEVVIASESDSVYVLRGDGTSFPGWPVSAMVNSSYGHTSSPVVADLDLDGELDILFAANDGRFHAWDRTGQVLPGWANVLFAQDSLNEEVTQATPTVASIDADDRLEVLIGAENGLIYAWNDDGTVLPGFPITTGGEIRGAVSVWDLDADNFVELLAASNDRNVYVWDLTGEFRGNRVPWPFFRHDVRNTGRYETRLTATGVAEGPAPALVVAPVLHPAAPNPFNPATAIRFLVPGEAGGARPVRLGVYDLAGRLVRELVDGLVAAGEQAVAWDGRTARGGRAASGAYFVRLEVGGQVLTGKLTLLK